MSQVITMGTTDNDNTAVGFSGGSNAQKSARSFVPTANYNTFQISAAVWKAASPTDNIQFEIQSDSAGLPSGTILGTVSYPSASLGSSDPGSKINYGTSSATLTSGVTYWLVVERSSTLSATNYYNLALQSSGPGIYRFGSGTGVWVSLPNYDIYATLTLSSVVSVNGNFLAFM